MALAVERESTRAHHRRRPPLLSLDENPSAAEPTTTGLGATRRVKLKVNGQLHDHGRVDPAGPPAAHDAHTYPLPPSVDQPAAAMGALPEGIINAPATKGSPLAVSGEGMWSCGAAESGAPANTSVGGQGMWSWCTELSMDALGTFDGRGDNPPLKAPPPVAPPTFTVPPMAPPPAAATGVGGGSAIAFAAFATPMPQCGLASAQRLSVWPSNTPSWTPGHLAPPPFADLLPGVPPWPATAKTTSVRRVSSGDGSGGGTSGSRGGDGGPNGAATATEVTHGITLRGAQLTWAILHGLKKVENRHFRMSPGWYALHTGQKTSSHESQHELIASVVGMPPEMELPHAAIVGAIQISHGAAARPPPARP